MKFRTACCQMTGSLATTVDENKRETRSKAERMIREAAANGCDVAVLPEMWNTPYSNKFFRMYGETAEGETVRFMSELAEELGIYLVGGSISELDGDSVFNTCFVFDRKGEIIARHRKVHLFDVDIEGGISFKESQTLSAGDSTTVFDTEFGRMGAAICFDVRFPDMFRKMTLEGAQMIFLPAAFNMTTGPAHWDLTMRARALDNQIFFAAVSPARDPESNYVPYGHSIVTDPWGEIVCRAGSGEEILYADIDTGQVEKIRRQLPLLSSRKEEIYR